MATVLTNNGEQWAAERLVGDSALTGAYVGWGSGADVADKSDTDLSTPETEERVEGTVSAVGSGAAAKYQVVATMTADGNKTITNAGNFTSVGAGTPPSGGVLIVHGNFAGIALSTNDQITFTLTIDPS